MKKILLGVIFCMFTCSAFCQEARVNKVQGKAVFYLNEPIGEYEVVFTFKTDPLSTCTTISGIVEAVMKAATYEAGAQGKQFDAVIIGSTERDLAIKFKENNKDNTLATPQRIDGKYFYVFSEPTQDYNVTNKLKVFRANAISGECRSVITMVELVMKDALKGEKKGRSFSAVVIGNDQFHNAIQ